jgi:DNA primase catalytic core
MARIPDEVLTRLKAEVSVQRLVEGCGVQLRVQGRDLVGRCPFHDDSTPSLVVTPGKNLWNCLGACRRGGGPIDWVMAAQGVSFRLAVELLQQESPSLSTLAQSSPSSQGPGLVSKSSTRKLPLLASPEVSDADLAAAVVDHYAATLAGSPEALGYVAKRGVDHPEVIGMFRLGYANRTLGYRLGHSQTKTGGTLRARLQSLGFIRESGHEHFTGSLVVPIFTAGGAVGEVYGRKVRDDLRAGTPTHLYLPGPHRGVFNAAGLVAAGVDELIVTESVIDALSLWCSGFRHVTAAYGTSGWTPDHDALVDRLGVKRVLVAFDADEAGDRGAADLAQSLTARGVECYRVELPRGSDANEVAVQSKDARAALGRFLRKAAWMGGTRATPTPAATVPARVASTRAAVASLAGEPVPVDANPVATEPDPAVEEPATEPAPPADMASWPEPLAPETFSPAVLPDAASLGVVAVTGQGPAVELRLTLGNRSWRVRGLDRVSSFEALRVNVLVARTDTPPGAVASGFHVDTLDLYSARARGVFIGQAAAELKVAPEVIKSDLGRVLLACEAKAEEVIAAAAEPERKAEVVVAGQARDDALTLLRDPRLIDRVVEAFAAVGMVGEATNCLVGYLAAISRKLPAPLAVIIQSTSAAGKSAVMEAVLGFVPPEDRVSFSAMTGQSLFYLGESDLAHKVLSIAEEEGASRAAYALKLLQSEGELSIASTGKDTTSGRLVTHTYSVKGPTAIVLTTTAIDVDEELLNRCLVLTVDEDRAQTQAIHQAQRQAQTLTGLTRRAERERVVALHRDAQRLLEPVAVVNPYADRLTFADGRTRTRRDHGKYLNLIAAVTLLHQHQRERKTATVNGQAVAYVESTVGDIEVANQLAHAVLGQSLDELAPQTRRLLLAIHDHVTANAAELAVDASLVRFTRRQLREALHASGAGWGDTQLKVHLARLVDLELLHVHRTDSGSYGYELTWRPPTPAPTRGDVPGDLGDVAGDVAAGYGRFLVGLTDPATLTEGPGTTYDRNRSGQNPSWSGGGRPLVGGRSGPGRPTPNTPHEGPEQREQSTGDAVPVDVPPDALIGVHGLADVRRGA